MGRYIEYERRAMPVALLHNHLQSKRGGNGDKSSSDTKPSNSTAVGVPEETTSNKNENNCHIVKDKKSSDKKIKTKEFSNTPDILTSMGNAKKKSKKSLESKSSKNPITIKQENAEFIPQDSSQGIPK